jgi:hypothetical protein
MSERGNTSGSRFDSTTGRCRQAAKGFRFVNLEIVGVFYLRYLGRWL